MLEHARERVDAVRQQAGEPPALVAMRALVDVLGEQRQIRLRIEQEQDAEPVAFVGRERLDRRRHRDRSDDRVALVERALLVAHADRHAVGAPRLGRRRPASCS